MQLGITAATGQLGRLVLESLQTQAPSAEPVALVRNPAKAANLGVPVRQADYAKPETLAAALAGIDVLLLISSNELGQRFAQHRNVIEAAQAAGVRRVVYTSLLHADSSPLSLAPEHRQTEEFLLSTGLPYTILRNGWYTENYTGSIPSALAHGALVGSAGDGLIASAARADYAAAAARVLTTPGHENQLYELAGDTPYTLTEFAAELSRQSGKPIPYRDLPPSAYAQILAAAGLPPLYAEALPAWDAAAATGALFDNTHTLSKLLGRPTTPLSVSIAEALAKA